MKLLRVRDAAALLAVEESTVRKWILCHKIPIVRVGRCVRIRQEDLEVLARQGFRPAREGAPRT